MVASGVRFKIHAQLRVPWRGVARGTRRAPFATSSATRLTCAGALAFAAPPPKKEAMLLCPLIAARKAVQVARASAGRDWGRPVQTSKPARRGSWKMPLSRRIVHPGYFARAMGVGVV